MANRGDTRALIHYFFSALEKIYMEGSCGLPAFTFTTVIVLVYGLASTAMV
jgi:hypothetical protein